MKQVLYDYDIFPMVFPVGQPTEITVKPLGAHAVFNGNETVKVQRLDCGSTYNPFTAWNHVDFDVKPDADGCLRFTFTAEAEVEHYVRICRDGKCFAELSIYALNEDLAKRIPLKGDLHLHTFRSDGRDGPAFVCANYRKRGYDFLVITDHFRYYPSLEAMKSYAGAKIPLNILPGEEVHLPGTEVHIVNAGGLFSVNGLLPCQPNYTETDGKDEFRRLNDSVDVPAIVPMEEYYRQVEEIEKTLTDCPDGAEKHSYAVCKWAFERIHTGGGLAIFAHPYWIADMWQIPEVLTNYILRRAEFDAFEVLGGENYYEQNGFQTALYYNEYREGRVHPIVGSTDSHCSTEHNRNADICSTIVFAEKNERASIVDAVKKRYSVAVDSISKEYRLVGEFRFQKYASFLMENFYPIHDREAFVDGELMRQYSVGDLDAETVSAFADRAEKLIEKYIKTI